MRRTEAAALRPDNTLSAFIRSPKSVHAGPDICVLAHTLAQTMKYYWGEACCGRIAINFLFWKRKSSGRLHSWFHARLAAKLHTESRLGPLIIDANRPALKWKSSDIDARVPRLIDSLGAHRLQWRKLLQNLSDHTREKCGEEEIICAIAPNLPFKSWCHFHALYLMSLCFCKGNFLAMLLFTH